jgi:uracil-DNA glycosylase
MTPLGTFPFGQPLLPVRQEDRTPKRVFILGVYASAVHARWVGPDGKTVVNAMAVASEPYIFWRGDDANEIISRIDIPPEVGTLAPAPANLNGPSGIALDELFLTPLGFDREDAWLCDLVPHSCVNPSQAKAIERSYEPLREQYDLPEHSIPPVPTTLADDQRRGEILQELQDSQAETLILLGDQPIKWFLRYYDKRWMKLSDFQPYGQRHRADIDGMTIDVLPLVHPRQAARLGASSKHWHEAHQQWMEDARG